MLTPALRQPPNARRPDVLWWASMFIALMATVVAITTAVVLAADHQDFPEEQSAEAGFARDMTVHHEQAVQMAEIVRGTTANEEIRVLATDIALTQQAQMGRMRGWLDVWGVSPTGARPPMAWMGMPVDGLMPGMATPEELAQLRALDGEERDALFLRLMIDHHRAGVDMANAVLRLTDRPEVVALASAMTESQQAEIAAMTHLLAEIDGGDA